MNGVQNERDAALVSALRDQVGDGLRFVAQYEQKEYELLFLREDLESAYTPAEFATIFEDFVLQGLHTETLGDPFSAGDLVSSVYEFDDAVVFHLVDDRTDGTIVSVDASTAFDLERVSDVVEGHR